MAVSLALRSIHFSDLTRSNELPNFLKPEDLPIKQLSVGR